MSFELSLEYASRYGRHRQTVWSEQPQHHLALPDYESELVLALPRSNLAQVLVPLRLGRFYPSRILQVADAPGPVFRVIDADRDHLHVDFNQPLSGLAEQVAFACRPADLESVGRIQDLMLWAGFETALPEHDTDFADSQDLPRDDADADARFYAEPRFVQHMDATCAERISALYGELIPSGADTVLDLMASWRSQLPDPGTAIGLGLNAAEMAGNPQLEVAVVHDLNRDPRLPFRDDMFDVVVNTVSMEYLVTPDRVLESVHAKLRSGGVFAVAFSNRFFPPKAVRLWKQLHPVERVGWVASLLQRAGFEDIRTRVEWGIARSAQDAYADHIQGMDPMMAVWGYRA